MKDIIQRGYGFFFITDDNLNKSSNNEKIDNFNDNNSNDNYVYFYRCYENVDFGEKLFFCGSGEISKLVGEEDFMDRVKFKKPKLIDLEEEYIKQNYLKKKNDITLKPKNIIARIF